MENSEKVESAVDNKKEDIAAKVEGNIDSVVQANSTGAKIEVKKLVSAQVLLDAGIQIGLSTKRWNPKMKPFIYKKRTNTYNNSSNYVIDLTKTIVFLYQAYKFLFEVTKNGGSVVFVGTKKNQSVKDLIKEEAQRTQSHYVTQRWLGGTLTNFRTIYNSIKRLNDIVALQKFGEIDKYTKKEQVKLYRETEKLNKFVGGIRLMNQLPQALVVVDPVANQNAIVEAKKMHIPVVALANTNADPTNIDFIIPCNNVSIRSLTLVLTVLADAIAEAKNEPLKFVGKEANEIVLPEVQKKPINQENILQHKNYSKSHMQKREKKSDLDEKAIEKEVKSEESEQAKEVILGSSNNAENK